jgi:hypothetical protein
MIMRCEIECNCKYEHTGLHWTEVVRGELVRQGSLPRLLPGVG